jgi:hypothetical protein
MGYMLLHLSFQRYGAQQAGGFEQQVLGEFIPPAETGVVGHRCGDPVQAGFQPVGYIYHIRRHNPVSGFFAVNPDPDSFTHLAQTQQVLPCCLHFQLPFIADIAGEPGQALSAGDVVELIGGAVVEEVFFLRLAAEDGGRILFFLNRLHSAPKLCYNTFDVNIQ